MSPGSVKRILPLPGVSPTGPTTAAGSARTQVSSGNFQTVLDREILASPPLDFSAHAQSRLLSRKIHLSGTQIARLENGVEQAARKGAKDSLVMLDNLAFIVSVPNRKVVTALDGIQAAGNVFTQIDSAVIV